MASDFPHRRLAFRDESNNLRRMNFERAAERAQQRALDRIEEREHLRLELKAREYIQTVHGVIDTLVTGMEPQRDALGAPLSTEPYVPLDRSRVQALKAAMDGSLRLLDRVLPPLKAVEVQEDPEKTAVNPTRMTTSELVRLVQKSARAPVEVEAEAEVVEPETKPPWE